MSENKKGAGRPANPKLITVTARQLVFTPNVRHSHLHNIEGYNPMDATLYGDSLQKMYDANIKQHHEETPDKEFRFLSAPIVYELEGDKYEVQVGNSRGMTMLTYCPDLPFVVELRSARLSREEQLAENTSRTDMSDLAIAFTIHQLNGIPRRDAIRKAGWSDAKAAQWSLVLNDIIPEFLPYIERKEMSLAFAMDVARQNKTTQKYALRSFVGESKPDNLHVALGKEGGYNIIPFDDPRVDIEGDWDKLFKCNFVVEYVDELGNCKWYVTDHTAYKDWYAHRKEVMCALWNKEEVEEHSGYTYGNDGTTYHEFKPYDGKGKAWWFNHQLCYIVEDKAKVLVDKVEKATEKASNKKASEYAMKKVMAEAANNISRVTDVEKLCKILCMQQGNPYLSVVNTLQRALTYYGSFLREQAVRELVPEYQARLDKHKEDYVSGANETLDEAKDKLAKAQKASISIFLPAGLAKVDWMQDTDTVFEVLRGFNPFIMEAVKQKAKDMGVNATFTKNYSSDIEKVRKAIKRLHKDKTDAMKLREELEEGVYEDMVEGTMQQEIEKLYNHHFYTLCRMDQPVTALYLKSTIAPLWKKYISAYHDRQVQLKWSDLDTKFMATKLSDEPGDSRTMEWVMTYFVRFLKHIGQDVSTVAMPIDPMPKKKEVEEDVDALMQEVDDLCECGECLQEDCDCELNDKEELVDGVDYEE